MNLFAGSLPKYRQVVLDASHMRDKSDASSVNGARSVLKVNSSKGNTAIGSLTMCVSVVILLAGMLAGIVMGARQTSCWRRPGSQGWPHIARGILFPAGLRPAFRCDPAAAPGKPAAWSHLQPHPWHSQGHRFAASGEVQYLKDYV